MRRYTITLGASTTANGKVTTASSAISVDARVALEGDLVQCQACGHPGKILCDGPRLPMRFHGRMVTLSGDLCMCACAVTPRLVASQNIHWQEISGDAAQAWAGAAESADVAPPMVPPAGAPARDERALFVDEHSGQPIPGARYAAVSNGQADHDVTDHSGHGRL